MKNSIFRFTFIIIFIIFLLSSLFFLYSNPNPLKNITYGSSSSSSISGENEQLIDKIAIKITDAKPSADYICVKKVLEKWALQEHNKGGNAQVSLTKILNQISQNLAESKVVDKIVNLALKESSPNMQKQQEEQQSSKTQQQNQVTPQPTNNFSNRNDNAVSDNALEIDPTNIDALVKKSNALYVQDRYDVAIQYLDKALQIDPNDTEALNGKGDALYDLDRDDEAIQAYDKALSIDSSDTYALNGKGDALYDLEKYNEAIQAYDKALQIDPEDQNALDMKNAALKEIDEK